MLTLAKSRQFVGNYTLIELQQRLCMVPCEVMQLKVDARIYNVIVPVEVVNQIGRGGYISLREKHGYNVNEHMKSMARGKVYDPTKPTDKQCRYSVTSMGPNFRAEVLECI